MKPLHKALIGIFVAILIGYTAYETRGLLGGPLVTIKEPSDGFITASSTVTLKGTARRTNTLTLNGKTIFIDQEGVFSEELLVVPGNTILEVTAVDTFSRKTVQQIRIIRKSVL